MIKKIYNAFLTEGMYGVLDAYYNIFNDNEKKGTKQKNKKKEQNKKTKKKDKKYIANYK